MFKEYRIIGEIYGPLMFIKNVEGLPSSSRPASPLAQTEKGIELLAEEIERTRRRVNALEYVLIPNLTDTIKHITMRLAEMDRSNLTRLMKVKDIVRAH